MRADAGKATIGTERSQDSEKIRLRPDAPREFWHRQFEPNSE
jgi:hypothetical protein